MGPEISMTREIVATLRDESSRAHPLEACGLLLGEGDVIRQAVPCANVAANPARHFEIDPAALIAALRQERAGGLAVLGYYHSHPRGESVASATDIAMAAHDGRIWAIVAGNSIGWWRDGANGFEALSTRLADG
jgi:proteasome lid subunit RPN8/RPN11